MVSEMELQQLGKAGKGIGTYISLREYRNSKLRAEHALGYYDNINGTYVITDRYKKVTDIIEKFQNR